MFHVNNYNFLYKGIIIHTQHFSQCYFGSLELINAFSQHKLNEFHRPSVSNYVVIDFDVSSKEIKKSVTRNIKYLIFLSKISLFTGYK